jgi:hypothetical protein
MWAPVSPKQAKADAHPFERFAFAAVYARDLIGTAYNIPKSDEFPGPGLARSMRAAWSQIRLIIRSDADPDSL